MSTARTAGVFYLLTFLFGFFALAGPSGRAVANLLSGLSYIGVVVAPGIIAEGVLTVRRLMLGDRAPHSASVHA